MSYHEERGYDPVDKDAKRDLNPNLSSLEDTMQRLESHLAEDRVHHDEQSNGFLKGVRVSKKKILISGKFFYLVGGGLTHR